MKSDFRFSIHSALMTLNSFSHCLIEFEKEILTFDGKYETHERDRGEILCELFEDYGFNISAEDGSWNNMTNI